MKYLPSSLLLLIGASMVIIYPLALDKIYGEIITKRPILQNNTWVFGNQTFTKGKKNTATSQKFELYLSPEMSPVRVSFPAKFIKDKYASMDKYSRFSASLKMQSQLIWGAALSVKQSRDSKDKKKAAQDRKHRHKISSLGSKTFDVATAGNYTLEFTPEKRQDLEVTNIELRVKRNVAIPNKWIIGLGVVVLVAGFGLFARARKQ